MFIRIQDFLYFYIICSAFTQMFWIRRLYPLTFFSHSSAMDTASEASRSVSVLVRKYPLTYTKEDFLINVCIRNIFMECFPRNNKICRTPGMTLINSQQNAINTIGYTPQWISLYTVSGKVLYALYKINTARSSRRNLKTCFIPAFHILNHRLNRSYLATHIPMRNTGKNA